MGGSASNDELLAKVIELQGIPEHVASVLHSDNRQTKLGYNLAWAHQHVEGNPPDGALVLGALIDLPVRLRAMGLSGSAGHDQP